MMDSYAAHLTQKVNDTAWSRGYIALYHYGCTTALAQVNDTHLHAPLSKIYQDLETECFLRRQDEHGSKDIGRSVQEIVDDVCETWRRVPHDMCARGHLNVGLTNNLDGTQDGAGLSCQLDVVITYLHMRARSARVASVLGSSSGFGW